MNNTPSTVYRGRFAPSPTGPLHFGSLFAAVISYLDAKKHGGQWLVRIDDIDTFREQPGSTESILSSLNKHGLIADETITFQSANKALYTEKLSQLKQHYYFCPCSRKSLLENHGLHSQACVQRSGDEQFCAVKFKSAPHQQYCWHDLVRGNLSYQLIEDFVLKRKEGFYSYQLASVCDDLNQNITHVVRGVDLLESTPMQLALFKALDTKAPQFAHFPVIVNSNGQKLSKQNLAPAINDNTPIENLQAVLKLLNIQLNKAPSNPLQILKQAVPQWNMANLTSSKHIQL